MFEHWYHEDPKNGRVHEACYEYVQRLADHQRDIAERHLRCAWLYNNAPMVGADYGTFDAGFDTVPVTENAIESVIDTATSMIAKNRPLPKFRTINGGWSAQRRNVRKTQFFEAEFDRLRVYDVMPEAFRDDCVFGVGVAVPGRDGDRATLERALIDEFLVDEREARTSRPRQLHRVRMVDRDWLKSAHPEFEQQIEDANKGDDRYYTSFRRLETNEICLGESYYLPTRKGAGDGRYVKWIQTATLVDTEWKRNYFPYVFIYWNKRITGFYGRGLAESLAGAQLRVNKLNRFIATCQDLVSSPRMFVHVLDAGLKQRQTNEIGKIYLYAKEKPTVDTPQAVAPEIYQYKDRLVQWMYQAAGISELSAQSRKPGGLESAVALREFNDIETQRFSIQAQRYEAAFVDLAHQLDDIYRDIMADGGEVIATYNRDGVSKEIAYADCHEENEECSVIIEAASIMSRTPAGRLQAVIEMAQAGLIDQDEARRLMGHPDIDRSMSLYNAAIDDAEALIEELLEEGGEWRAPQPFQNLELCLQRVQMAYLKAQREGAPEGVLQNFRDWMELADAEMSAMAAPAAPPMGMMPPGPQAPPGMPPPAAPLPPEVPQQMPMAA